MCYVYVASYCFLNVPYILAALLEQSNDLDNQDIDTPTIVVLIILGIGTLLLVLFMGSVAVYYWVPSYAKCLENNLGITTC